MAVGYKDLPTLHPVAGVRVGVASAGIKKPGRRDLVLFELASGCTVDSVFTRNAFCAAPVIVAREHLQLSNPRYLLVNSGNANAGNGDAGLTAANHCCEAVAQQFACQPEEVLPFSTGVIGESLPVEKIAAAMPDLNAALGEGNWEDAARGIMTTDTVPKGVSKQLSFAGKSVTITGISKGSGMIRPDMGTMLAYVATDAAVEKEVLQSSLREAVNGSFNRITIDGDTSTNDACVLVATGKSGVSLVTGSPEMDEFQQTLNDACRELAQLIIRDGEGATKFISVEVVGGRDKAECESVAYTIAHSPLVKTAMFASDPNWGRILAAVGRAGLTDLDLKAITIHLGPVCIVRNGGRADEYSEAQGQAVMDQDEITVRVDLARGKEETTVWTCDFSYDYVRINAEYRT